MSVKRSWDVRRETKDAPESVQVQRKRETLRDKRKRTRTIFFITLGILLALAVAAFVYVAWQPYVRISEVTAEGPNAEVIQALARETIVGTYGYVLPKNSIFIYPESSIRDKVLVAHPAVAAVSISRTSFTAIHIKSVPRTSAFVWCGESAALAGPCFDTDAEGLVFAEIPSAPVEAKMDAVVAMDVAPVQAIDPSVLRIYAPLESEENDDGTPMRAHVVGSERIPNALRFVKAVRALNVNVVSVEIRGDEADLYTPHGTRVTYILGNEEKAAALAASAFPTLNIQGGQLAYVDLRFEGKVYIKRHGEI